MARRLGNGEAKKLEEKRQQFMADNAETLSEYRIVVEEQFEKVTPPQDLELKKEILRTKIARSEEHYKNHGTADRNRRRRLAENPPSEEKQERQELRAAAQAAFILGQHPSLIAAQYGLSPAEIVSWRDTLITAGAVGKRDRLSDMLMLHIEQEIKSLMTISMVTEREEWILAQGASELAQFYAVKADRLFAVLQAFSRVQESREVYVNQLEVLDQDGK